MDLKVYLSFILILIFFNLSLFSQSYYPTQIGNEWHYFEDVQFPFDSTSQDYTDTALVRITGDTLMPNDTTYFIIEPYDLIGGRYVFVDSNYVHYYDPVTEQDVSLLSLKGDTGEYQEFQFGLHYNRSWIEKIDTLVLFGDTTRSIHFVVDGLIWTEVSLSEKFGMHFSYFPGEPGGVDDKTYLRYCNINGQSYGTPLPVGHNTQVAQSFSLSQNYPNPFNASTRINFSLIKPAKVSLILYNIAGEKVMTIFNGWLNSGKHSKLLHQNNFSSGIYFYELQVGRIRQIKKCVVVK